MSFSENVRSTLWGLIDEMAQNPSSYVNHSDPGKVFTRKRKWDFSTLVKFMLSMEGQSVNKEILKYFCFSADCPSASSFNQRRSLIKADAFQDLFYSFTSIYNQNPSLYNGYLLLACDGSDLAISPDPKESETYFVTKNHKGYSQLHLNAMYNLLDKIYIDAWIQPRRKANEHEAFCAMVDRYKGPAKTIFLADRGYEAYNDIAHVMEKNQFFLFRCKDINSAGILAGFKKKLPEEGSFDLELEIILTRKYTNEVLEHPEIYRLIEKRQYLTCIDVEKNPFYKMKFRAVRFPISETEYECVLTNLPKEEFHLAEIKKLYAMRWGIETSFRELKYAVGLTHFHAKKREYISQEIWARLLLYNFCKIITKHVAVQKSTQKHIYQLNDTFAIQVCRYFISKMAEKSPPDVETLIKKELLPVRPDRHYLRKVRSKGAVSFIYRVS